VIGDQLFTKAVIWTYMPGGDAEGLGDAGAGDAGAGAGEIARAGSAARAERRPVSWTRRALNQASTNSWPGPVRSSN